MLYTLKGGYVYTNKQIVKTNIIVQDKKIIEISDNVLGEVIDALKDEQLSGRISSREEAEIFIKNFCKEM